MDKYFLILAIIFIGTAAQVFLKLTANQLAPQLLAVHSLGSLLQDIFIILKNYKILSLIILYAANFLVWFFALTKFELSYAFPLTTSIIYILVLISSWLIFKENITALRAAGILIIALGAFLVAKSA